MGRPRIKIVGDFEAKAEKKTSKESVIASPAESGINSAKQSSADKEDRHVVPESRTPRDDEKKETKKTTKPGKAKPRSKKYQEIAKDIDRSKTYSPDEAIKMTKILSISKFNGTLEAHINTLQAGIRGLVSLPFVSGKKLRILVFGKGTNSQLIVQDDTIIIGNDETIESINKGKIDFDLIITTPDWMPKLSKVARILGPRSLMPNPKNGTIVSDLKKAVEGFQTGKIEYKTETKAPVIHIALGKLNQPDAELVANLKTLLQIIGKSRIKKVTLSPTMGPSVRLDLSSL